jgi:hypothetical protein
MAVIESWELQIPERVQKAISQALREGEEARREIDSREQAQQARLDAWGRVLYRVCAVLLLALLPILFFYGAIFAGLQDDENKVVYWLCIFANSAWVQFHWRAVKVLWRKR